MRRMRLGAFREENGIAIVKVLLLVAIMLALGTFGARSSRVELKIANNELHSKKALGIAEAGLQDAYGRIVAALFTFNGVGSSPLDEIVAANGTGGAVGNVGSGSEACWDGNTCRYRSYAGGKYHVRVEDNHDEAPTDVPTVDTDDSVIIHARGTVGQAERFIEAVVEPVPLFGDGLFGREWVDFGGGGATDSFNSNDGPYGGSNLGHEGDVGTNGDIEQSGNAETTIDGDASASETVTQNGQAYVLGETEEGVPPVLFPPVAACGPPYCNQSGGLFCGALVNALYNLNGGQAGELRVQGGNTVTLTSGEYCFKSITLTGNSTLAIDASSGPVIIRLTDDSNLSGGNISNPWPSVPANLQIYSSYVSTNDNQGLSLAGGSAAQAVIYAPDAAIKITGGSDFYGSIVGKSVKMFGDTQFHYDEALGTGLGFAARLAGWHERRN